MAYRYHVIETHETQTGNESVFATNDLTQAAEVVSNYREDGDGTYSYHIADKKAGRQATRKDVRLARQSEWAELTRGGILGGC